MGRDLRIEGPLLTGDLGRLPEDRFDLEDGGVSICATWVNEQPIRTWRTAIPDAPPSGRRTPQPMGAGPRLRDWVSLGTVYGTPAYPVSPPSSRNQCLAFLAQAKQKSPKQARPAAMAMSSTGPNGWLRIVDKAASMPPARSGL